MARPKVVVNIPHTYHGGGTHQGTGTSQKVHGGKGDGGGSGGGGGRGSGGGGGRKKKGKPEDASPAYPEGRPPGGDYYDEKNDIWYDSENHIIPTPDGRDTNPTGDFEGEVALWERQKAKKGVMGGSDYDAVPEGGKYYDPESDTWFDGKNQEIDPSAPAAKATPKAPKAQESKRPDYDYEAHHRRIREDTERRQAVRDTVINDAAKGRGVDRSSSPSEGAEKASTVVRTSGGPVGRGATAGKAVRDGEFTREDAIRAELDRMADRDLPGDVDKHLDDFIRGLDREANKKPRRSATASEGVATFGSRNVTVTVPETFHGPTMHPGTGSSQKAHGVRGSKPRRLEKGEPRTPGRLEANRKFWKNVIDASKTAQPRNRRPQLAAAGDTATFADEATIEVDESTDGLLSTWEGVLAVEGVATGDGRMMLPGSLRWGDLPVPLRWQQSDEGEHKGAVTVGRILEMSRVGNQIRGRGDLDLGSEAGREVARLLAGDENGPLLNGVSIDVDEVDVEVRMAVDAAEAAGSDLQSMLGMDDGEKEAPKVGKDGRVKVKQVSGDDQMMVTTDGRIRAATIVQIPAFAEATLSLVESEEVEVLAASAQVSLVAGGRKRPPAGWFTNPKFGSSPEQDARLVRDDRQGVVGAPVTVTKDGRIFGHLALWGACHTGFSECVSPPASQAGYRYFHVGSVETADGSEVATGRITLDTLHAGRKMSAVDTLAHYEHTGLAVADVVAGEDDHGIWIAGAVRGNVSEEQRAALKASPLSGDWRRIGGSLELVAALAVNSPGFPVPRAMVASGAVQTLQVGWESGRDAAGLSDDDVVTLRQVVSRERRAEVEAARRKVMVASAAARVRKGR